MTSTNEGGNDHGYKEVEVHNGTIDLRSYLGSINSNPNPGATIRRRNVQARFLGCRSGWQSRRRYGQGSARLPHAEANPLYVFHYVRRKETWNLC